jgi:hypothetical protein
MTEIAETAATGTALVVCRDPQTCQLISQALHPLAVSPKICEAVSSAASLLDKRKFEAVIVDMLFGNEATLLLDQLRLSRANRTAVSFAITTGNSLQTAGIKPDSTFVLRRPLLAASVNQIFRAAYGLIVRERRRYFRCPIAVPAFVRAGQPAGQPEELFCHTVDISEGGVAISAPPALDLGLATSVRFSLPGSASQLSAEAKVRWRDQRGRMGLEFQSLLLPQKSELQEWLARKLEETLPENVAALFRSVSQMPP